MDIDKLKILLSDQHKFFILEDMSGPTALQGGKAIIAKSHTYKSGTTEAQLAEEIVYTNGNSRFFAFYESLPHAHMIRYALI